MIDDCRYLEFGDKIFSLEHIKYIQYGYKDGNKVLYDKVLTITYWDNDTIELIGINGYNKHELDKIYEIIREVLLNSDGYEEDD